MNGAEVLDVGRDAIWLTLQLCAPIMIVGLVVGVVIGLFQACGEILRQQARQATLQGCSPALAAQCQQVFAFGAQGDEAGLREVAQAGDVVAVVVRDDDPADLLAADAAGYARLMAVDERATVEALDAVQGRVIDMAGDSVLPE